MGNKCIQKIIENTKSIESARTSTEAGINKEKNLLAMTGSISLQPRSMILTSFKKTDNEASYILRFHNISHDRWNARITLNPSLKIKSVQEVNLDEISVNQKHILILLDNVVNVNDVERDEVVTLKIKA